MNFNSSTIPKNMKDKKHWVLWAKAAKENGKIDKIPINARTLGNAQPNNPSTWTDFDTAYGSLKANEGCKIDIKVPKQPKRTGVISGLGFMLTGSGFSFVDLDHVDNDIQAYRNGQKNGIVWDIMHQTEGKAYAEISQSGEGVHIILNGQLPSGDRKNDENKIEMYDTGRYVAMTGNLVDDTHTKIIDDCTDLLKTLHNKYLPPKQQQPRAAKTAPLPVYDVDIQKALDTAAKTNRKFAALWAGDTTAHGGDESAADLALCNILAYYLHGDPVKIDTAFRSSGLMREKWDQKHRGDGTTYGQMTIETATKDRTDFFDYSEKGWKKAQAVKDFAAPVELPKAKTGYPDISECSYSCTKDGEIKNKDYNYQLYLLNNGLLDNVFYDEFSQSFVNGTEYINDDFFRRLYGDTVQANFFNGSINEKQFTAMCEYLIKKYHTINIAKQYFDGLKWDGKPRIETLMTDFFGVEDNELSREALKIWLTAAVKRVYSENPVQFDYILMLKGDQGSGKTSFFNALGLHGTEGRHFCNSLEKSYINNTRSFALNMIGKLICYDGDLKVLKDTKNTDIKNFITKTSDTFDNKYDRRQTTINRQFVIGADTNEPTILNDITGNRRYIILTIPEKWKCEKFHSSNWRKVVTDDGLTGEQLVNQIWAETVFYYKKDPENRLELSEQAKAIQSSVNETYNDTGIEPFYDDIVKIAMDIYKDKGTAKITDVRSYADEGILAHFSGREQVDIIKKCLAKAGFDWRSKSVKNKKIKVFVPRDIPTQELVPTPEELAAIAEMF